MLFTFLVEAMDLQPLTQLCEFRLVVCTICQFACVAEEVLGHLRTRHRDVPLTQQQAVAQAVRELDVIQSQAELADFRFPLPSHGPVAHLQPPRKDGRRCHACGYITCDPRRIRAHCRQQHQWQNLQGKGRPAKGSTVNDVHTRPWRENVWCQRFFHSRVASRWFEVSCTPGFQPTTPARPGLQRSYSHTQPRASLANLAFVNQVYQQETQAQARARQLSAVGDDDQVTEHDTFTQQNGWLTRTRWPTTYAGVRRDVLVGLTQLPDRRRLDQGYIAGNDNDRTSDESRSRPGVCSTSQDEQRIACLVDAVDQMIARCEETARYTG